MQNLILNAITILLGAFFFGLLVYGFYIVLFPYKPKEPTSHNLAHGGRPAKIRRKR